MDLREVGYDDRDWINLAQDRDRWRAYEGGNEPFWRFREKYGRAAPERHTIVQWHKHLLENGDFQRHGGGGRKSTSDENLESNREAFTRSPRKSVRQASRPTRLRGALSDCTNKIVNSKTLRSGHRSVITDGGDC
ncbi:hypothetical protein ANN_06109 [Periplaneta americana]|uniref:Uncharacterized protein n=1 Tax=Periplaneta americana TaxID=6978 RepID=A0ABQ8TET5_PERAM|nr:hypothetical protein ANN_06109 [Periplaneta americana]